MSINLDDLRREMRRIIRELDDLYTNCNHYIRQLMEHAGPEDRLILRVHDAMLLRYTMVVGAMIEDSFNAMEEILNRAY